jgi:hypothetical protein
MELFFSAIELGYKFKVTLPQQARTAPPFHVCGAIKLMGERATAGESIFI